MENTIRYNFTEDSVHMSVPTPGGTADFAMTIQAFDQIILDYIRNYREKYVQGKQIEGLLFDDTGFSDSGF